jgi:hypothetical protein
MRCRAGAGPVQPYGRRPWWVIGLCVLFMPRAVPASSPLAWSPDGEWLSYVIDEIDAPRPLRTDWIFDAPSDNDTSKPSVRLRSEAPSPRGARLWVTQPSTKSSVLIEQTTGRLTSPAWSHDGHAIAFGRLTSATPGPGGRFEIIAIEGPNRRTLYDQPIDDWNQHAERLSHSTLAWSPDGRFLAVPLVKPAGLGILRTDTGRLIKILDGASQPAWVPDGSKLLYISSGGEDRLECLESHFGASRLIADLGQVDGPPLVSRDGMNLVVLTRKRIERGAAPPAEQVELWRVRIDDGRKERLFLLGTTAKDQILSATSLTQDRDGENLFSTLSIDGQPSHVTWFRPRERSVYKKFPVLDPSLRVESLSLSPAGGTLALRIGNAGIGGLPVLCELDSMQLTPLIPDSAIRDRWKSLLLANAEQLLREVRPSPIVAGRAIDRASNLPIPGEVDGNSEPILRLRRLGRLGHSLSTVDDHKGSEAIDFLFDYIREDYPAALLDLETIAEGETDPERRLRMLNLRAQVYTGLGDFERARGTFGYLKSIEASRIRRSIEVTSEGIRTSTIAPPDAGWADYALRKLDTIERELNAESADATVSPFDHRNPDAPQPIAGDELDPPQVPKGGDLLRGARRRIRPQPRVPFPPAPPEVPPARPEVPLIRPF